MLIFSRGKGDKVIITSRYGEVIEIAILDIDRNKIKIGIEADRDFTVDREEVHQNKVAERAERASVSAQRLANKGER